MATLEQEIRELIKGRRYEEAIEKIRHEGMTAELYLLKGNAYFGSMDFERAIESYTNALKLDANLFEAYNNRGNSKSSMEMFDEAIKDYQKAIEINDKHVDAYFNMGLTYYCMKKIPEAIECYTKTIECNPEHFMAYNNRGNAKNHLKDYLGALKDFTNSIDIRPTQYAYFNRALSKENLNDLNGAISDYDRALSYDPSDFGILQKRGYAKFKNNDFEGAEKDYIQILNVMAENTEILVSLGMVYHNMDRDYDAIIQYTKAISVDIDYADAYINRSIAAASLKKYSMAVSDLDRMFKYDIFRNDYLSTYNQIREIIEDRDDEKTKEFRQTLEEMALKIKPKRTK